MMGVWDMKLYKGNIKSIPSNVVLDKTMFCRAEDEKDAERIMNHNLNTRYYSVVDIKEADMTEMDEKSIPIGFRHPLAY